MPDGQVENTHMLSKHTAHPQKRGLGWGLVPMRHFRGTTCSDFCSAPDSQRSWISGILRIRGYRQTSELGSSVFSYTVWFLCAFVHSWLFFSLTSTSSAKGEMHSQQIRCGAGERDGSGLRRLVVQSWGPGVPHPNPNDKSGSCKCL